MENQKPLKEKVSITLDSNVVEKIKELSGLDNRSFSQYINLVLINHINNYNKKEGFRKN